MRKENSPKMTRYPENKRVGIPGDLGIRALG